MDIFDMLKQAVGPQANEYADVFRRLSMDAVRWAVVGASGVRCAVRRRTNAGVVSCADAAIGACLACEAPVCLGHAMVAPDRIMCFGCVQAAKEHVSQIRSRGDATSPYEGPPKPQPRPFGFVPDEQQETLRKQHLDRLCCSPSASWKSIQVKYKRLAFDIHPDRVHGGKRAEEKAAKRLQELNESYAWLREFHSKRAA